MIPIKTKYGQTAMYVVLLIIAVLAMVGARRCSSAPPLPMVMSGNSEGDTLDVAIVYGPLSYYLYSDTLGGLNYTLLEKMRRDTRRNIKLWPVVSLHDALDRLDNGTYDMLASMPLDNEVRQRFLTTESVFLDRLVLVQKADTNGKVKINSALDLGDDTIHLQLESPAAMRLTNLSNEIGKPIPVKEEKGLSEEYLCIKVASGDFKLAVVNEKVAKSMKETYPTLHYDNPVSFTQFQVWVFPKSDSIPHSLAERWLDSIKTTPYYKQLIEKY